MGDGDQGDCVVYGTPLENELEMGHRRRAKALEKGTLRRQQPVWQQEVRDTEGRRRFHGAFTGGFSAGYYNTVGSKEGWEPATFKSSRTSRADKQQNSAYDYMDADEKNDMDSKLIGTSQDFDTFGFTAAEYARRGAQNETKNRPSAIPGPVPDELIVPVTKSIGVQLLMKMGWRHGRVIGPKHVAASSEAKREGRKAMMALSNNRAASDVEALFVDANEPEPAEVEVPSNTPTFVLNPKNDVYGLGFDPYKHAPEFRERKAVKDRDKVAAKSSKSSMFRPNAGTMSRGFGIGALEDMGEEDEDIYASGPRPDTMTLDDEEDVQKRRPASPVARRITSSSAVDVLPGFKVANESTVEAQWFHPPAVPPDYEPVHKFAPPLNAGGTQSDAPPEAAQPDDRILIKLIDGLASLVAKSGLQLEALNRERNKDNPQFQFLFGGTGSDYYTRRLWEERLKHGVQSQPRKEAPKLDASERGKLLGETQLQRSAPPAIPAEDRARLQASLQNTFTKPPTDSKKTSHKPFKDDHAKQARYEVFLKMKYTGGLRKMDPSSQQMSEVERAQELLEFENAALGVFSHVTVAKPAPAASIPAAEPSAGLGRFTSAGQEHGGLVVNQAEVKQPRIEETTHAAHYPRRTEEPWRPAPLLCKRFDLPDPYLGRAVPAKAKSKTDSLTLSTSSEALLNAKIMDVFKDDPKEEDEAETADDDGVEEAPVGVEQIQEKPVDLYKAIFSDDSDEETGDEVAGNPQVSAGNAANAALNRLVADDFLESLGKELGLRVPPPIAVKHATAERRDEAGTSSGKGQEAPSEDVKDVKQKTAVQIETVQAKTPQQAADDEHRSRSKERGSPERKSRSEERGNKSKDRRSRSRERKSRSEHRSRGSKEDKSERRKDKKKHRRDDSSEDDRRRRKRERREEHGRSKSKRRRRSSSSSSSL